MSKYKDEIYKLILSSDKHLTAEEIFISLKQYMPNIVLATVYNNLNSLYLENKIKKISIEGQSDKYDKNIKHDHLICSKCKKIQDVFIGDLSKELSNKLNIKDLFYDLKIYYLCPDCKNKEAKYEA